MDHRAGSSSATPTGEGRSDTPGSSSFPEGTSDIPDQGSARRDPRVSAGPTRLRCSGSDSFDPHSAVTFMKELFKMAGWNRAMISWGDATEDEKKKWFEIFSVSYSWDPSEHQEIYKRFKAVASRRLRSIMSKARTKFERKGDHPKWIADTVWREMCAKWDSERAVSIRDTNRANRAQCNALYCGGSISTTQHLKKLKDKGEDLSAVALFDVTHTKKGRGQLVDERAQTTRAAFTERMTQYQSQDDGTGATPLPDSYVVWGEVAGVKKGRVYGLGSEASSATPRRRSGSQSQSESSTSEEIERMRQELAETRDRLRLEQEVARERDEREERLRLELEELRREQQAQRMEQEERYARQQAEQAERYTRLEQLMLSMSSGRGTPLPLTRDDILPPPSSSSRPSSSGSSRGRGRHGGGRS